MNRFITIKRTTTSPCKFIILFVLFCSVLSQVFAQNNVDASESANEPVLTQGRSIHADLNSQKDHIYVLKSDEMWSYNVRAQKWKFLSNLERLPKKLKKLESGYDSKDDVYYFWDRGVGSVYKMDPDGNNIVQIDNSHSHRNQYSHQPFIKDGTIYAFGGYGYWSWKNYITYFNKELGEWNIQNVDFSSDFPQERIINTGTYIPSQDALYIFGGRSPTNDLRADDNYTKRSNLKDIWKFSFVDKQWQKIGELDPEFEYYKGSSYRRFGRINKISSSFYSDKSNIWYIPTIKSGRPDLLYFTPVNTLSGDIMTPILIESDALQDIVPSNFLFDQDSSKVIIVGLEKKSGVDKSAVKVVEIAEDSLLSKLGHPSLISELKNYILIFIGVIAIILGFILYKKNGSNYDTEISNINITKHDIKEFSWLKKEEKSLLVILVEEKSLLESNELEESVWSEVDNYDYRRKKRNETIRHINRKFKKNLKIKEEIIVRVKDPQDNRRNLYKVNEIYLNQEK